MTSALKFIRHLFPFPISYFLRVLFVSFSFDTRGIKSCQPVPEIREIVNSFIVNSSHGIVFFSHFPESSIHCGLSRFSHILNVSSTEVQNSSAYAILSNWGFSLRTMTLRVRGNFFSKLNPVALIFSKFNTCAVIFPKIQLLRRNSTFSQYLVL